MKKKSTLFFLSLIVPVFLFAEKSAQEIANEAAAMAYYQGTDGKSNVRMQIVDNKGRIRERQLSILRKNLGENLGKQKFYVYFKKPADVYQTSFLVWKNPKGDDDRWMFLPALDLVRRIAASDERTSFVGSHFFYEDVSGRGPDEDTHELVKETEQFYVLKSTPKDASKVEFAYYKSWIHKASMIAVKIEYYDSADKAYRTYEALKVEQIQGIPTVTQAKMTDHQRQGYTLLTYNKVNYNTGLKEDIFSERSLRNPPLDELPE